MRTELTRVIEDLYHNRHTIYRGYAIYRTDTFFVCPVLGVTGYNVKDVMDRIDEKKGR